MPCYSEYWNLAAGGLAVVGSGFVTYSVAAAGIAATAASGGTVAPGAITGVIGSGILVLGSIAWTISAWLALENCLRAAGKSDAAAKCQARREALQREYDRLQAA